MAKQIKTHKMNLVKTYIDKDNFGGIGLFAAEFIPKGTLIWKFGATDKKWDSAGFSYIINHSKTTQTEKDYLLRYTSDKNGIVYFYGDDAKYCNHSNTPNTHGYPETYA